MRGHTPLPAPGLYCEREKMSEEKLDNIIKVIDLLEKIKALLMGMVSHSMLISESVKEMIGDCKVVNQCMREAALGLKALAAEATKEEFTSPAEQIEQGDHGVIKIS
jgi:hypothetical protein